MVVVSHRYCQFDAVEYCIFRSWPILVLPASHPSDLVWNQKNLYFFISYKLALTLQQGKQK